ncbi:GGDEF domain-containing protein [Simiduia aestuariiviva]|uniref:diguanylate cyclase n=1 Tax=Simiduia aestuariiviva TaxID=1510459 RepID=A0A839UQM9_9GAMM|nr:GGDEF domain-containing protein [Simiduia aestuariiviva]MBB3167675.1 diguanylate cyclase (GGDEF)-like protein [Simiduia aestuariiviva]
MQSSEMTHSKYKRVLLRNTTLSFVAYHIGFALTLFIHAYTNARLDTYALLSFLAFIYLSHCALFYAIKTRPVVTLHFTKVMLVAQMVLWMIVFIPWNYFLGSAKPLALILAFFGVHYLFLYARFLFSALTISYLAVVHLVNSYIAIHYFGLDDEFYLQIVYVAGFVLSSGLIALHSSHVAQKIRDNAAKDSLTQLYNRRHFLKLLEVEQERVRRHGEVASLLMLDIDHFKNINDSFGHYTGDKILTGFAQCITKEIRANDFCCRWGGEEFLILLCHTNSTQAYEFGLRLKNCICTQVLLPNIEPQTITFSGGISQLDAESTVHESINRADELLYLAKEGGRDRICGPDIGTARAQIA